MTDAPKDAPVDVGAELAPGTDVGGYIVEEKIGEGGFGVVYLAEQQRPIKRRVALKIIKPGMDSREVVARFEAERQALAMMDHPNIARVLDGGASAFGRPYFVMDLAPGPPIVEYCEQNRLPLDHDCLPLDERGALNQRMELVLATECLPASPEQRVDDETAQWEPQHQEQPRER